MMNDININIQGKSFPETPIKNMKELTAEIAEANSKSTEAKELAEVNTEIVADKDYDTTKFSGMGRVNLRKNIVDGHNYLTQEMVSKPNTIYKIQYDYEIAPVTHSSVARLDQSAVIATFTYRYAIVEANVGDTITINPSLGDAIVYMENGVWTASDIDAHTPSIVVTESMTNVGVGSRTKGLQEVINYTKTVKSITIPEDCVLEFEGGSLRNGTIVGQNTVIDAGLVKIFNTIELSGKWDVTEAYPEWFGAKGDGITDDTKAIKSCATINKIGTLRFAPGAIYIVNIEAGTVPDEQRNIFYNCKFSNLQGNGATIKLGNNNNCDKRVNKGIASIFNIKQVDSLTVRDLVVDFNYSQNPIYQTNGRKEGVTENIQQNAFNIRDVKTVMFDNCTFIDHSGTNCIDYACYDSAEELSVTIINCKFLKCGQTSFYDNGTEIQTAAHDVSTVALHHRTTSQTAAKLNCVIHDNYFEGIGINCHNAMETSADYLNYYENTLVGFRHAILPCTYRGNHNVSICNNKFLNTGCPIRLWMMGYSRTHETSSQEDMYAFQNLIIADNICEINIPLMVTYSDYQDIEGGTNGYWGFVSNVPGIRMSLGSILVVRNKVTYLNYQEVEASYSSYIKANSVPINLSNTLGTDAVRVATHEMVIKDNEFTYAPSGIVTQYMCNYIEKFVFSGNKIVKPAIIQTPSYLIYQLTNFSSIYPNGATLYTGDIIISDNRLDLTSPSKFTAVSNAILWNAAGNRIKTYQVKIGVNNISTVHCKFVTMVGNSQYDLVKVIEQDANSVAGNSRPTLFDINAGFQYFDTLLNKPIYWTGTKWVESDGATAGVQRAGLITKRPALADIYTGFMYLVTQPWEDATLGTDGPAGPYYFDGSNSWILADGTTKQDGQMPARS